MNDDQTPAPSEAGEDDVQPLDIQEQPEAVENTEGQDESQPAEGDPEQEKPEDEVVSASKARRERRKAQDAKLKAEVAEAEARAKQAEQEAERVKRLAQQSQPPNESEYDDLAEYQADLSAYKSIKVLDDRAAAQAGEALEAQQAEIKRLTEQKRQADAAAWQEQVAEAKGRYADFESVAYSAPIGDGLAQLILTSDVAADVAYHLGANPDDARRISSLSPLDQARELGRIEATMSAPKPKTTTTAPDPINPVRGSGAATKDPSKMSVSEYRAWREAGGTF